MKKGPVLAAVVAAALTTAGVWAVWAWQSPADRLPLWVQTRPSMYLRIAIDTIRAHAVQKADIDWTAITNRAKSEAAGAKTAADTYPAIRGVLDQLGDRHSMLIDAQPSAAGQPPGAYGLQVLFPEAVVAVVFPSSPAETAGIHAGDVVELVNGVPPVVSKDVRARGHLIEMPRPSVTLRLRRAGDLAPRDVQISVGALQALPAHTRRLGTDIGVVEIPGTYGQGDFVERVRSGILQADGPSVCGWIVDLRRNNGGSLWPMLQVVRPILGEGILGYYFAGDKPQNEWTYPVSGAGAVSGPVPSLARPGPAVAVITSRLTSGAGEAASIAFRGRASSRVFGEPTWGLPTASMPFKLPDGAVLELTQALEADRTRRVYSGRIDPDEKMTINWALLDSPDDPVAIAAATWLRTQPSCKR